MKVCGRFTIKDSDNPKPGFVEWVKSKFAFTENQSGVRFEVDSDSQNALEFVSRLRASFEIMPLSFWHIDYSKSDIENASLLHIWCSSYIAELAHPPSVNSIELAATKALKSPRPIGGVRPYGSVVAVNDGLKERLDLQGLKGLQWVQLYSRNGRSEHQPIWKISSSVVLPPTPVPLKHSYGEPFEGNYEKGCLFCSPYREEELAYTSESIKELGQFDVAVTREFTGNYPGACFQWLVITQAFRKALKDSKLRGIKYTPVRLLESGDPVVRNPLEVLGSGQIDFNR